MSSKSDKHLEEVDHGYVRYANVWEDPNLLIEGLHPLQGKKVLSIASAGDNAFALLSENPELVVAIDLNYPQLYLTELKMIAIKNLSQEEFIKFVGFRPCDVRLKTYESFSSQLSEDARVFWDEKSKEINQGVCLVGKFENYLKTFAKKLLPLIHSKRRVSQLFFKKSKENQEFYFQKKWNTWRWRLLFRFFFSKQVMGFLGRDPAFLDQVEVNVGKTIMNSAAIHLRSIYAQNNPMLHFCLRGNFGNYLPYYAKKENYEKVKGNLDKIRLEYGYAQQAQEKYGSFDRFNLSNIFEYMPPEVFESTSKSLLKAASPAAKFSYWNLMVKKEMSAILPELSKVEDNSGWAERDQGFFYMQFVTEIYN